MYTSEHSTRKSNALLWESYFVARQLADSQNPFSSSLETESVFTQALRCPKYKLSPSLLCSLVWLYDDVLVNEL